MDRQLGSNIPTCKNNKGLYDRCWIFTSQYWDNKDRPVDFLSFFLITYDFYYQKMTKEAEGKKETTYHPSNFKKNS